jgi:hypothetical protein
MRRFAFNAAESQALLAIMATSEKGRPMHKTLNFDELFTQIQANAKRIETLVSQVSDEQARWKPDAETWSLLEVVNHLHDEEMLDFRIRLGILLSRSGSEWPPIDPAAWVVEREYNTRDLPASLQNFLREREKSIQWLSSLENPDWQASATAPWGREMSAGEMFASWVAHDLLHIRQLVELHWAWLNLQVGDYPLGYAGDW